MTNEQLATQFEITWTGGPLLPPREGGCSLTAVATSSRRDHNSTALPREHRGRHPGVTLRKYTRAEQDAARALRAEGYTFPQIAERTQIPMGTLYAWIQERRGR